MRIKLGLAAFLLAMALGAALPIQKANASPDIGLNVGVLGGATFPSATGQSSRFGWGLEGDYQFLPFLTAGVFFLTSSQSTSIPAVGASPAVSADNRISLYGAQSAIKFGPPGLAGGIRLGVGHLSTSIVNGGSTSDNSIAIGPYASYDYKFATQWSFGGDASILFVQASQSYNVVNLLATLKFWL
jgi:hypothetical protein